MKEKEVKLINVLISIIVPVYKVEDVINRCIDSLINQTYRNVEIILVDDGSPDSCPQICDEYARIDERVKVIHKKNGGLSDARNVGLKFSKGDFVLFVDSDDYIDIDACQRFIDVMKGSFVDIIVGDAIMYREKKKELMLHDSAEPGVIYESTEFVKRAIVAHEWYAPACLNMYKRSFMIENGLYYKKGIYFEDMEMLPRMFLAAKQIIVLGETFYHYVVRENSITTSRIDEKKETDVIQILLLWKEHFDNVTDFDLQKCLYGMLIRCYLHECRVYHINEWRIPGVNLKFAVKYGIGIKEKTKGILFAFFPNLYIKL